MINRWYIQIFWILNVLCFWFKRFPIFHRSTYIFLNNFIYLTILTFFLPTLTFDMFPIYFCEKHFKSTPFRVLYACVRVLKLNKNTFKWWKLSQLLASKRIAYYSFINHSFYSFIICCCVHFKIIIITSIHY